MKRLIRFIFILNLIAVTVSEQSVFKLKDGNGGIRPKLQLGEKTIISAPDEGLWSIATAWENKWPAQWHHASPVSMECDGKRSSGIFTGDCVFRKPFGNKKYAQLRGQLFAVRSLVVYGC